ncbi:unnamed protein product, partial [Brenthis ino]
MDARVAIVALCVTVVRALQPAARIYIESPQRTIYRQNTGLSTYMYNVDIEKRHTTEVIEDFKKTKTDTFLLYTDYTTRVSDDLKAFQINISSLTQDTIASMQTRILDRASRHCRDEFENSMNKIGYDANRTASFNALHHHKYFLGYKIVLNIHLNKADCHIRKCEKIINSCGVNCETIPQLIRYRRLALWQLNRVKDDLQHSRRSYSDLLVHSRRNLDKLRKKAQLRANDAVAAVHRMSKGRKLP